MESHFDLDDVGVYGQLDPSGMTAAIESFPEQCRKAEKIARDLRDQYPADDIREVVVLGMGGSAIGGDVVKALLENALSMPVTVHRGYCPCKYYSPHTLLFAVSYSGNTEETLASLDDAVYQNCKVVAITSGGTLLQKAQGYRWPTLQVPEGLQPRAALPYLTLPMAIMLEKMGMVRDFSRVLGWTVTSLGQPGQAVGPPATGPRQLRQATGATAVWQGAGHLRYGRAAVGGRLPLEMPDQRELQGARLP